MENRNIKKLKLLSASLCLGAALLTGCGNKQYFGSSKISYESETPEGKIKYDDLSNCLKIVTLEQNEMSNHLLLMKETLRKSTSGYHINTEYSYVDLKTGTTIIKYKVSNDGEKTWGVGENLNIVEEQDITGYLLKENYIKNEYDVNEVITFFEESILPTLDSSDKVMTK